MPNNPPAFPAEVSNDGYIQTGPNTAKYSGMTLLDYFAGQALAGWIASGRRGTYANASNCESLSADCYTMAQAMLTERARRGGDDDA